MIYKIKIIFCNNLNAVMAEWLTRKTRNLLGYACAGSNPADCDSYTYSGIGGALDFYLKNLDRIKAFQSKPA